LQEIFPGARIGRMDRDTVRGRGDMERLLTRLHSGEINLLVGTQMIAKGHDIHGVTLVGVVGADHQLGLPDFRAAERVFQLLTQVSGRAGRGELAGKVVVQTYHPEHYAVKFAAEHDYLNFVAKEMQYRRWMHYPPHAVLANIVIHSPKLEEVTGWSAQLGRWFQKATLDKVRVLGPAAAPIMRLKRVYRYHFILKAQQRQALGRALRAMLAQGLKPALLNCRIRGVKTPRLIRVRAARELPTSQKRDVGHPDLGYPISQLGNQTEPQLGYQLLKRMKSSRLRRFTGLSKKNGSSTAVLKKMTAQIAMAR